MSAPREHTSEVPIRSAQITKDLTTAHVIARDIMEMQRTVNRVSSAVLSRVSYNIHSLDFNK